jgi:hypothetical protein
VSGVPTDPVPFMVAMCTPLGVAEPVGSQKRLS